MFSLVQLQNALHTMAEMSTKFSKEIDSSKLCNSKWNLLLSDALAGNSRTAIIVTLRLSMTHS